MFELHIAAFHSCKNILIILCWSLSDSEVVVVFVKVGFSDYMLTIMQNNNQLYQILQLLQDQTTTIYLIVIIVIVVCDY